MRRILACVVLVLAFAISAEATTYYVRSDGNNSNFPCTTNSAGGACLTIDFLADNASVTAGDVIRVQSSHFGVTVSPTRSGTAGNLVTIIADGGASVCGFSFSGQSYIRVIGFVMDGTLSGCSANAVRIASSGANTGLEFWNNSLDHSETGPSGLGIDFDTNTNRCVSCIFVGNSVNHVGSQTGAGTNTSYAFRITGDDTYVGYTNISNVCYIGIAAAGTRMRFVNSNFSGMIQCNNAHPDFFYPSGSSSYGFSGNLHEATFGIGTPTSNDNKFQHVENASGVAWDDNVWRFNVSHMLGSAAMFSMYSNGAGGSNAATRRWKYYNNTLVYGNEANNDTGHPACGNINTSGDTTYISNNIFFRCWAALTNSGIIPWNTTTVTITPDYNLAYDDEGAVTYAAGWTNQSNEQSNVDPSLNDVANDQFWIGSSSSAGVGARGTGGPLTTATSCSGTTLNLATDTGSYFIGDNSANLAAYSGALVPGDFLTINSTTYQVVSRSTDALTLNTSLTCANGDAVYFGKSSTIDIGAFPYKANGYTLSGTYQNSGGTVTVTPNDATLVRFLICYDNGIPYAVDNASPFTCTAPSGTLTARLYPLYASTTQSVDATDAGTSPDRRRFRFFRRRGSLEGAGLLLAILCVRRRWADA